MFFNNKSIIATSDALIAKNFKPWRKSEVLFLERFPFLSKFFMYEPTAATI